MISTGQPLPTYHGHQDITGPNLVLDDLDKIVAERDVVNIYEEVVVAKVLAEAIV
jgi:hypothetical protein